ncbi:MAG: hypothetical protein Kow00107_10790 [Planctomycetota bacterium]
MRRFTFFLFVFISTLLLLSILDTRFNSSQLYKSIDGLLSHLIDRPTVYPENSRQAAPSSSRITTRTRETNVLELASWNVRVFSSSSRDDYELGKICEVLQRYDFVALQELRDTEVLNRSVKILKDRGFPFSFVVSPKVGSGTHKEMYAFLFRTDAVSHLGFPSLYPDPGDRFIREPFVGHFRSGNFDFSIATVHVIYKSRNAPERAVELSALADVFKWVQEVNRNENDVLLTGDFNEHPDSPRFARLLSIEGLEMLIRGSDVTTVIFDSSLYDNIAFSAKYTSHEYSDTCGVFKFDEEMFSSDDEASRVCSDHRPVWARFATDLADDD